ncbi:Pre rRNA processing protein TSR2 region [Echinococcus multilocularis]|uniref:Pre-rRNA-processing protein TSR2 homolog n=1 Tax=Echinococcus multilocularis TaxID=6211 RepID=A0A068YLN1_ECHMU|nr:Pre rRNA processing protein TSR2 region [Echinococcus multilocularis]
MDTPLSRYIQKVFSSWTVLRIAEQQCSGGMDTPRKIRDLVPYITQRLTRQTQAYNIAEWLDEYLCQVLNVLCEDDSHFDVADLISEAYSLHLAGKINQIVELTAKVPAACDLSSCSSHVVCDGAVVSDISEESGGSSDPDNSDDDVEMDIN